MAEAKQETKGNEEMGKMEMKNTQNGSFKFNVHAPEFVPRSSTTQQTTTTTNTQVPVSGYFYPCFHFLGGSSGSDWFYVGDQESVQLISSSGSTVPKSSKNYLNEDLRQKIIKQVEYQFSDMSLFASDTLMKHISKDPEGYVPISVIASSKKIKALVNNNHFLVQALKASPKLIVSDDGKRVRRKHLFTDRDKEDLQARTVVVENLPEDYTHQNLEKIFGVVGSVKTVRVCHPQEANTPRSKGDVLVSNKLHALVEFETVVQAEKAVEKLNDERNWRKGLRVRLLLRRSPRSVIKTRKTDYDHFDGNSEEEEDPSPVSVDESSHSNNMDLQIDPNPEESLNGSKKGWARGRGKSRGRVQSYCGRGLISPAPQSSNTIQFDAPMKHTPRGPRMPDGTRGFTMGRGKPLTVLTVPSLHTE